MEVRLAGGDLCQGTARQLGWPGRVLAGKESHGAWHPMRRGPLPRAKWRPSVQRGQSHAGTGGLGVGTQYP